MKYLLILFGLLSVLAVEVQLPEVSPSEEYYEFLKEWDYLEGNTFVRNLFELKEKLKDEGSNVALLVLEKFIEDYKYNANNVMLAIYINQLQSLVSEMQTAFNSSNQKGTFTDPYEKGILTNLYE